MSETINKGWLKERDGTKFAPATVIDQVLAANGYSYDIVVKGYMTQLSKEVQEQVTALMTELETRLKNFNGEDSDTFYIIDKNDNVIAKIDADGVHSIDFITDTTTLETFVDETNERLKNFDGGDSSEFLIIDKNDNIIARIDANGITTTELHATDVYDSEGSMRNLREDVNERLKNFNGEDSSVFYIIDKNDNVIARVDAEGIHSINFSSLNYDIEYDIKNIYELLEKETNDRVEDITTQITDVKEYVNNLLKNFNGEDTDTLYIVDGEDRVIAKFDKDGLTVTNVITNEYDVNATLKTLLEDLAKEIQDRKDAITKTANDANEANVALEKHIKNEVLKNFDGEDSDVLYIIDSQDRIIAKIDDKGIHSINFGSNEYEDYNATIKDIIDDIATEIENREDAIDALKAHSDEQDRQIREETLKHFSGEDSDTLYIIDNLNRVIAKVDKEGVHSINFISDEYDVDATLKQLLTGLDQEIKDRVATIESLDKKAQKANDDLEEELRKHYDERLQYFNGEDSNVLYIIDSKDNVIARIDANGVHSVNFTTYKNNGDEIQTIYDINFSLDELYADLAQEIEDRTLAIETLTNYVNQKDTELKNHVENTLLKNFNGEDGSTLYIVDKYDNVIAKFDAYGLTVTNVIAKNGCNGVFMQFNDEIELTLID